MEESRRSMHIKWVTDAVAWNDTVTLAPVATIRLARVNRAQTRSRGGLRFSQSMRLNGGLPFGVGGGGMERFVVLRILHQQRFCAYIHTLPQLDR
jgi:hypothetical protein